jgi:hypothetical protein
MSADMQSTSFEDALSARVDDMFDARAMCGACFAGRRCDPW